MTKPDGIKNEIAHKVAQLLEGIRGTLPTGCAELVSRPMSDNFGLDVALIPSNEGSAEVGCMIIGDELYSAFFGKAPTFTTFEFPWEVGLSRKSELDEQLEAFRVMCMAVVAGNCEHRRGRFGTSGTIFVTETKVFRVTNYPILAFFQKRRNPTVMRYAPYREGASTPPTF
jgi:hypothetical protein